MGMMKHGLKIKSTTTPKRTTQRERKSEWTFYSRLTFFDPSVRLDCSFKLWAQRCQFESRFVFVLPWVFSFGLYSSIHLRFAFSTVILELSLFLYLLYLSCCFLYCVCVCVLFGCLLQSEVTLDIWPFVFPSNSAIFQMILLMSVLQSCECWPICHIYTHSLAHSHIEWWGGMVALHACLCNPQRYQSSLVVYLMPLWLSCHCYRMFCCCDFVWINYCRFAPILKSQCYIFRKWIYIRASTALNDIEQWTKHQKTQSVWLFS